MQIMLVVALLFASFVALFALQNAQTVAVRFFAWEMSTSVAVIVLLSAAVGAIFAMLAGFIRQMTLGFRLRQTKGDVARVRKELDEARQELEEAQRLLERLRAERDAAQHRVGPPTEKPDTGEATIER